MHRKLACGVAVLRQGRHAGGCAGACNVCEPLTCWWLASTCSDTMESHCASCWSSSSSTMSNLRQAHHGQQIAGQLCCSAWLITSVTAGRLNLCSWAALTASPAQQRAGQGCGCYTPVAAVVEGTLGGVGDAQHAGSRAECGDHASLQGAQATADSMLGRHCVTEKAPSAAGCCLQPPAFHQQLQAVSASSRVCAHTLAMCSVCCSMASWIMALSCSLMDSNSSMQQSPPSASTSAPASRLQAPPSFIADTVRPAPAGRQVRCVLYVPQPIASWRAGFVKACARFA
jgi:hypothetical protein